MLLHGPTHDTTYAVWRALPQRQACEATCVAEEVPAQRSLVGVVPRTAAAAGGVDSLQTRSIMSASCRRGGTVHAAVKRRYYVDHNHGSPLRHVCVCVCVCHTVSQAKTPALLARGAMQDAAYNRGVVQCSMQRIATYTQAQIVCFVFCPFF